MLVDFECGVDAHYRPTMQFSKERKKVLTLAKVFKQVVDSGDSFRDITEGKVLNHPRIFCFLLVHLAVVELVVDRSLHI